MTSAPLIARLEGAQDADEDIALLRRAIGCQSVTGNESQFAGQLLEEMSAMGLRTASAEFLPGRINAWGERSGAAAGPTLMFAGHTDTVHVQGWTDRWSGRPQEDPFAAAVIDGEIWGRGACDLKGGLCAALASLRLLDRAGICLAGGVSFAFVGDEESGEPGTGVSAGVKELVNLVSAEKITKPDFAIYVEPTRLEVFTAQVGFFVANITVTGRSAYFGTPELGVDALKAGHAVLSAIWRHEADLADGPRHDLVGASSLLVTGIEAGGYIAVPGECRMSLIRKLRPGEDLDAAVEQFETAVRSVPAPDGVAVDIGYPAGRDHPLGGSPIEVCESEPAVVLLSETVRDATSRKGAIAGAPYWSELPFLVNGIGCPAVYCAPGDISVAHTVEERMNLAEYLAAIRAFALFAARFCGVRETN